MKLRERMREWFWPILEPKSSNTLREEADRLARDKASIDKLDLRKARDTALDEARRFADAEEDRRRVADQKATTYLAVVAGLVPLVVTLATAVWDKKAGNAPTWVNMFALGVAVAYASKAGLWSFRVLEVKAAYRIGISDLAKAWNRPAPENELARDILRCGRMNQAGVNEKISGIKMAHAFLLRAFLTFAGLLMFNIIWFIGTALWPIPNRTVDPWMASPKVALAAGLQIAAVDRPLSSEPAWMSLKQACAARAMVFSITLDAEREIAAQDTLRRALRMGIDDRLRLRHLRFHCGQAKWGELRIWGVAGRLARPTGVDPLGVGGAKTTRLLVRRFWPETSKSEVTLPAVLLRQSVWLTNAKALPIAYGETEILSAVLGVPPHD